MKIVALDGIYNFCSGDVSYLKLFTISNNLRCKHGINKSCA